MTEIQGKSILVRVSARFELARGSSYRESTVLDIRYIQGRSEVRRRVHLKSILS